MAAFFCRECYETKNLMVSRLNIQNKRNVDKHNEDIANITAKHYNGVSQRSSLSDIRSFDITKDLPHDPMHVLLEGICKYHLIDILQVILDGPEKRATLDELNTNIKIFNFGNNKSKNRPSGIKPNILDDQPSLSMTAAQTWNMIMLFPFIFHDIIDIEHRDYDFFNMLRLIMLIAFSNRIENHQLVLLDNIIKNYYKCYIDQPTLSNVPKLHYLGHLVDSIKRYIFIKNSTFKLFF